MHWVVQENICQEAKYDELIRVLERHDIPHTIVKVVPFSGDLIPEPKIREGERVWCMGSLSMHKTAERMGWNPGVININHVPWTEQKYYWGDLMLNSRGTVASFEELYHYKKQAYSDENFVRPVDDSKFIKGQIMTCEEIFAWAKKIVELGDDSGSDIDKNTQILICPVNERIQQEARFWIVGDQIATYSLYKLGNDVTPSRELVDKDMIAFASGFTHHPMNLNRKDYNSRDNWPAIAFCLDVCRVGDTEDFKIVEINNINSSGLYDADVQKLVMAIESQFSKI